MLEEEREIIIEFGEREIEECEKEREVEEFGGREIILGFRIGMLVLSERGC